MPRNSDTPKLLPGQAQYVVERLVSDGRLAPAEIARYVGDIQREIADVESRLQHLRGASGLRAPAQGTEVPERTGENGPTRTRARRGRKRRGNPLAGRYMG
jgi:polyhydroxyalkanoate synthesis regulator phasin